MMSNLYSVTDTQNPQQSSRKAIEFTGSLLDKAQQLQAPAVGKYVQSLREKHPDESPAQIIRRLETRYLNAVTSSGSAVGATAAIPGVGTIAALGAMAGETVVFLEASALLALAIAEVHAIPIHDSERRKTLVLTVALGSEGVLALERLIGGHGGVLHRLSRAIIPTGGLTSFNKSLVTKLAKKYTVKRAPFVVGKLMPAGIGAVIGGAGNRAMGKRVVTNARHAFGPPPATWTIDAKLVTEPPLPRGRR